jgi:hypothetical protein
MSTLFPLRAHSSALAVAALTTLSALIGCGGSKPQPDAAATTAQAAPSAGSFDPCSLLTVDEVQAAVGWAVVKATPYVTGDRGHCVYQGEKGKTVLPPEEVEAGVIPCWFNFPCASDMPRNFGSSAALVAYRKKLYEGSAYNLDPEITPIEDLGVPALMHELATLYSMEMWLGYQRLAYVSVWESEAGARSLGEKLLARAR